MFEDAAIRKDIIRAGATYPTAVSSSYYQPSTNPSSSGPGGGGGGIKKGIASKCNRNTRPRPAFGATRYEGAIGPIRALSPYADVVDYNQRYKQRTYFKADCRRAAPADEGLETFEKGPTAETIISMTAAGKKPPVPHQGQIERLGKSLLKISACMATAVSSRVRDKEQSVESIHQFRIPDNAVVSDKMPGYRQTWGVAFSQKGFAPEIYHPITGGARYPENYSIGVISYHEN